MASYIGFWAAVVRARVIIELAILMADFVLLDYEIILNIFDYICVSHLLFTHVAL